MQKELLKLNKNKEVISHFLFFTKWRTVGNVQTGSRLKIVRHDSSRFRNLPVKFGGDTLRRFGCRLSGGKKKEKKKKN